ncbi:GIY-YIG nuclease family protein [Leucobacter triazinivorans]|uniref:GIY-YIG nuclease family protein n=1 Tax=Leucobacter triazinivorans TaxID=1784719 RepID=A0A4P6KCE5_9MICO|nr:GIY-YIG nuclease family protein [Leucobacter triazinivorans]QBE48006.1 GIY-YIG nuclease family protein [Leucobacter triazinivorans]
MNRHAYVYLLASGYNGTLYVGVTSDLARRVYEHRNHLVPGFTDRYDVTSLVWYVAGENIVDAIALEKKIKNRSRRWKIDLIERENPSWEDLAAGWYE